MRSADCLKPAALALTITCLFAACAAESEVAGWKPLFDGKTTAGWRGFRMTDFPKRGWKVEEGCLHLGRGGGGGHLVTTAEFTDFELEWEWRIAPKCNNGLKYFVTETREETPGHEYQMVDDSTTSVPKHQTTAFYDVLPPQTKPNVNPPGSWNKSRLLVQGNHVEHWLNGEKVLSYEVGSPELKAALAQSKFKDVPGFGDKIKGPIMLTDHYGETWYRSMRIRELPTADQNPGSR